MSSNTEEGVLRAYRRARAERLIGPRDWVATKLANLVFLIASREYRTLVFTAARRGLTVIAEEERLVRNRPFREPLDD
jgi:hypothetical protein